MTFFVFYYKPNIIDKINKSVGYNKKIKNTINENYDST